MKTRKELNLEYWGRVHDMCKGTELECSEWRCVELDDELLCCHPGFEGNPDKYRLAVCIVEDKPVFVGNVLYNNNDTIVAMNEYFRGEKQYSVFKIYYDTCRPSQEITWKKPTKKQTFSIECSGKNMGIVISDIPCPVRTINSDIPCPVRTINKGNWYEYETEEDKDTAIQAIKQILDAAEKANEGE